MWEVVFPNHLNESKVSGKDGRGWRGAESTADGWIPALRSVTGSLWHGKASGIETPPNRHLVDAAWGLLMAPDTRP